MPFGPGTYPAEGGGGGLAAPAVARQGIGQPGVMPGIQGVPDEQALSELVQMLRGGQAGAERFMQLLSLLAGSAAPQMAPQGPMPGQPPAGPAGGPPMPPGGDIAALLGG